MIRYMLSAAFAVLICTVVVLAGEFKGTITDVKVDDKGVGTVTVKGDDSTVTFAVNAKTTYSTKKKGEDTAITADDLSKNKAVSAGKAKATVSFEGEKAADKTVATKIVIGGGKAK